MPDVDSSGNYQSYTVIEVINEIDNGDGSYSGEVVVELADGSQENVIGTFFPSAGLYTRTTGDGVIFVVSGDKAINMPIGSYNYTGHAEALYSYNENQYVETGTFDMDVQFSDGTAQIMADANNVRYENNSLSINNDGDVFGVDGDYIIYDTDGTTQLEARKVDFDGTLHGSGATHVTGIAVGGATTDDNFSLMTIIGQR
ncbi:MAG: hypothetical protein DCO98_11455 [Altererythrobacter sp. XM-24bin4]|nr:MAG: hypothetical protein DCO98_11455 [Altererythrobacter sp. XM-24bin4]